MRVLHGVPVAASCCVVHGVLRRACACVCVRYNQESAPQRLLHDVLGVYRSIARRQQTGAYTTDEIKLIVALRVVGGWVRVSRGRERRAVKGGLVPSSLLLATQ